jgi:hypothetical protein
LDVQGIGFEPYTENYARRKQYLVGFSRPVNLWLWGNMMPNFQFLGVDDTLFGAEASAGFTDDFAAAKALWHNKIDGGEAPYLPQREFIGFSDAEADRRAQEAQAYLDKMWRS